ncbi:UDP-N-acetylglucosamine 2-epimerase (non-hydrolyzing) [Candidatus Sumerlaeota bacterium]|nr:UDP-N-acetylglucosamine 2-epimerase (non-hydrolyzing) [Candidatus Sumerlaeota bacterium]
MKKISFIFGTRPEAIKLAPIILALKNHPTIQPQICVTGQHREMLDQVLQVFGIQPDCDLELMQPDQTLAGFASRAIEAIDAYLDREYPDLALVQGDTTTVLCGALAAFYRNVPVGHVEAGLRTGNLRSPYPEEMNRVLCSRLTNLHFAPTETAKRNLLREGVAENQIWVTGNTVIDALYLTVDKIRSAPPAIAALPQALQPASTDDQDPRVVLITGHRRENFGEGFENICRAIAELSNRFADVHFVYPVHLNPNVREPVERILHTAESTNIHLIEPLPYLEFIAMMNRATVILTDSGGVQEEAPSLGKPVLVMRDTTERPEAVEMGTVRLTGTDKQAIMDAVSTLLTDEAAYQTMANAVNPYGDGKATGRILAACEHFFSDHT